MSTISNLQSNVKTFHSSSQQENKPAQLAIDPLWQQLRQWFAVSSDNPCSV